jgi:hypothetical protein
MLQRIVYLGLAATLVTGQAFADDGEEGGDESAEGSEEEAAEESMEGEEAAEESMEGEEAAEESMEGEEAPAAAMSSGGAAYGAAGCGLGSLLFDANSGAFMQILAATTNGTSGNQTFAITSGTSNCDGGGGGADSAKAFVETNRVALSKDAARGSGETISSLSELAGCASSEQVGRALQQNFSSVFPSAGASDSAVSARVVETLKADKSLACNDLS